MVFINEGTYLCAGEIRGGGDGLARSYKDVLTAFCFLRDGLSRSLSLSSSLLLIISSQHNLTLRLRTFISIITLHLSPLTGANHSLSTAGIGKESERFTRRESLISG